MACPFMNKNGRWQLYATVKSGDVQYYKIYTKLCSLLSAKSVYGDIVSTGSSDSNEASLLTNCGGVLPMVKSSNLLPVTVSELPAGTSVNMVIKTNDLIPQAVVIGL